MVTQKGAQMQNSFTYTFGSK